MWSSSSEFHNSLQSHPRGGVAPSRHDVALAAYRQRQADLSSAEAEADPAAFVGFILRLAASIARHVPARADFAVLFRRFSAALAGVAMAGLGAINHAEADGMKTLHVIEHAGGETVTDLGAKGDSAGDLLTFSNDVYDETDSNKVGSIHGMCIRVVVGASWECFWTLFHDDGQITVEGPFLDAGDSSLAITGGTGKFAGVRGEMALHARTADGSAYDLTYNMAD